MVEHYIIYGLTLIIFVGIGYGNTNIEDKVQTVIDIVSSSTFGVIIATSLILNM